MKPLPPGALYRHSYTPMGALRPEPPVDRGMLQALADSLGQGWPTMAQIDAMPEQPAWEPRRPTLEQAAMLSSFAPFPVGDIIGAGLDAYGLAKSPSWGSALGMAAGMLPFIPAHTVYHGSPNRINNVTDEFPLGRFDAARIGSGEGNQMYGHGLYFAEDPRVARTYADLGEIQARDYTVTNGAESLGVPSWMGIKINQEGIDSAIDDWTSRIADMDRKLADPDVMQPWLIEANRDRMLKEVEIMKRMKHSGNVQAAAPSNFYTADIPDEWLPKMLDWDAPLSEQSEEVQRALMNLPNAHRFKPEWTGSQLYESANLVPGDYRVPADASEFLRRAGIPGIKYFDGSSRGAGKGTRNFVVFPGMEDQVKILKRE